MKRKIITLIAIGAVLLAQAQIKMTFKSHGIKAGDTHDFVIAENMNEGPAGKKILWDFSALKPSGTNLTSHMLSSQSVDSSQQIASSNIVIQEFGNNFFFNVNNNGIEQYGTMACNSVTKYDKPFVKMKYPFTYGSNVSGSYKGTQTGGGSSSNISGTYELSGDAYGTLILPGNVTYDNVLRVKQTRTVNYEGSTSLMKEITYRWYVAGVRYPILVVIKYDNNGKETLAQTAYYAHASSQKSIEVAKDIVPVSNAGIDVAPNPFETDFTVTYNIEKAGKVKVELYDNMGRFVSTLLSEKQKEGVQTLSINAAKVGIKEGIYILKVSIDGVSATKQIVKL